jgi:hypothetical protein
LIVCTAIYGVLVVAAVAGGRNALLMCLLLLMGLLHAVSHRPGPERRHVEEPARGSRAVRTFLSDQQPHVTQQHPRQAHR